MNISNEIQQFDKLEIDFDKLVNSTQDIYEGCVLIINLHDKNRLNEFVDDSLTKKVEMIITSTKCDIKSENIVKFKNFNEVYNHAVHKMLPNLNSINFFGITGTNGKTTTGYYLNQLLGKNSLFIGTTEQNLFKEITNEEHLTTPKLFNIFKN